ncbi:FAD-binding monooxygenase tazF [Exophiala dermatitidis]
MAPGMLVQDGTEPHVNGLAKNDTYDYEVTEKPLGEPRKLRVITIGAGASGLNMARQIESHMKNVEHIIYEKNEDVGGTWFENRYPGCACDIPSHNYQFTWEPNPDWSTFYSAAPEILSYFKSLATKYELYRYIKLRHKVAEAVWHDETSRWLLKIEDMTTGQIVDDWCDFLINGAGILNNWKWPDIPGLHSFKGTLVHSANWPKDVDLKGKTVAVLGCGSSAVQIVPTIQPEVKDLVTFIRSPTWITAGYAQSKAGPGGSNFHFSEEQKQKFRADPKSYLEYRKDIEHELNSRFKFIIKDSPEQEEARQFSVYEMKTKLGHDPRLVKHLIPNFAVGCRRPTPGNGYLEALTQPNVRVVTDHIEKVVEEGIVLKTGETIKVDVFICATGFDISFFPRFPLIGRGGVSLADQWKEKPEGYLSLAVNNFPNYFMFLGPSSPAGHGSILPIIEHATKYMVNVMKKAQTQGIRSLAPTKAAVDDFNVHVTTYMKRTAWTTACRSWFKNGKIDGPVVALHPGSRIHWFHMLDRPRYEDFEIQTFSRNRFQYLGNGFSTREAPGVDTASYFDDPDKGFEEY